MANYQLFVAINNGPWNNDAGADPVTNVGGVDLSALEGTPVFPTVQGTGDGSLLCNFGAASFGFLVPSGYAAGWSGASGFTTLDPTKVYGSASLSGGNLGVSFPSTPGMVQALDGKTTSKWYFEIKLTGADIFTGDLGGGVGKDYAGGGVFEDWFSGVFNGGDIHGGGLVNAGADIGFGLGSASLFAFGSTIASGYTPMNVGDVARIAMFLTSAPPPPPTPTPAIIVPDSLGRWRGQVGINWNGLALVGDAFTNVVGLSDFTSFNEYGNKIKMLATAPPLHDDRKRIFVSRLEVEVEAGEGLPDAPEKAPQLMLDYSKDGGKTWVALQVFRSMGAAGDFIKRLRWINLGQARTWIFRIQYSDAARPSIIGTYVDYWRGLG